MERQQYDDRFNKALNDVLTREKQRRETSAIKLLEHVLKKLESGELDHHMRDYDGCDDNGAVFRFMFKWSEDRVCDHLTFVPNFNNDLNCFSFRVNAYLAKFCEQCGFFLQVHGGIKERLNFVLLLTLCSKGMGHYKFIKIILFFIFNY